jgi:hypothetical protein
MVANIRSGSSPGGALYYNKEKVDKNEAEELLWQKMLEPFDKYGRMDVDACMESFRPYLEANRRMTNTVFHASLNPSPEDKLTDGQLRDIAQEYMELWVTATSPTLSSNIRTLTGNICISYHYGLMRTAVKSKIHTTFSVRRICNQTTNSQIELDQFVTRLITSVTIVIESLHTTDYFCYAK